MPVNDLPSYSPQRARGAAEEEHMALRSVAQPLAREVGLRWARPGSVCWSCQGNAAQLAAQPESLGDQVTSPPRSLMSFLGRG